MNGSKLLKIAVLALVAGVIADISDDRRAHASQARIDFNRDIRPILSDKCFACHGPDAPNKKIKLRLDSEAAATADLGRGRRAVIPGNPQASELVRRITASDELMRMPPVSSGHRLTEAEIARFVEWIKQGAKWQQHWSLITPVRPTLPPVKNRDWPKNAIDYFVLERLEREGLSPSPEADRETLIRRLTLDLTGLPPALKEIDDFLNDKSPNAYEKVVDRLLASPRYGERLAFRWLDAARYADTNGYQIDGDRSMWRWRDWVIEAFNRNRPFDQFIIEQLAGDLLPNASLDQKLATAFNRNHRINAEGGIVPEEYRIEYVVDRVDTTSTVFLGLTMGCARCHNHKYDPLTQKEFYQFSAYFNSIDEDGHSFDQGNSPPVMAAPTAEQQARLGQFDREIAQAARHDQALFAKSVKQQTRWEKSLIADGKNQQWFPDEKLIVHLPLDEGREAVFNKSDRPHHDLDEKKKDDPEWKFEPGFKEGSPHYVESPAGRGAAFDGKLYFDGGIHADFRYKSTSRDYRERFTIAAWVYPESEQSGSIVTKVSDAPAEIENDVPRAGGYGMYFINGKIHFNMVFRWGEDALRVETAEPLPLKRWSHVTVVFDGFKSWEDRLRVFVDGREQKLKLNQRSFFLLFGGSKDTLKIGAGGGPQFRFKGALDEVRLYSHALDAAEISLLACPDSLEKIAAVPADQRTSAQSLKLQRAFLAQAAPTELKQADEKLLKLRRERQAFEDDLPTVMVMQEMPEPRPAFLLKRGAYDVPGERVERNVPAALPGMAADLPKNRLGLAKWLVSPEHPLTARVAVNRLWQMLFGTGLVKTVEDFGSQGELPSHPELLDWLSVAFRDGIADCGPQDCGLRIADCGLKKKHGATNLNRAGNLKDNPQSAIRNPPSCGPQSWNIKALLKTIVMSATYRQSSKLNPELLQRDPNNRLLARGSRLRLPAEMIRDEALFVSGLLVEKLGGPSVKPYQPSGLYKDMAFSGLTGYETDPGEGLWRRSLYTFWKRTVLSPNMSVFDASAREFCTVRETRTNTPLQSLNLMNDETYLEAARLLAQRMILEYGSSPQQRLATAFRALTSRRPTDKELQILSRNLEQKMDYFARHPQEAPKFLSIGRKLNDRRLKPTELAAYTATASLLLNLDEAITRQ